MELCAVINLDTMHTFTTLLPGAVASFVDNEPSPILALLPTEADCREANCRDYMVSDIEPVFAASPALRGRDLSTPRKASAT